MNVIDGDFGKEGFEAQMAQMLRVLPEIIAYQSIIAKIQKSRYEALIEEGMTEQQAIELCKQVI